MLNLYTYRKIKYKWSFLLPIGIVFSLSAISQGPLKFSSSNNTSSSTYYNQQAVALATIKDKTSMSAEIKPYQDDGIYSSKDRRIGFLFRLQNQLKESQAGNIALKIIHSNGTVVYKENTPFSLGKRDSYTRDFEFAAGQLQPGFYTANIDVSTPKYADVLSYSFGYEPEKVVTRMQLPVDFISYWENAKRELLNVNPNYTVTPREDLSKKIADVYEVQFNSTDKAVIKGWLSVPKAGSKSPVLYKISDYLSELQPETRRDVAVFSLNVRGVGGSNSNYNLPYENYGVYNLENKGKYILKGAYLDVVRGVDFLIQNAQTYKLDINKIVLTGTGLGASAAIATSVLEPRVKAIALETPTFISMKEMLNFGEALSNPPWPASMFKSFYGNRRYGIGKDAMLKTLDYFDPVSFAPFVNCPVLTGFNLRSTATPAQCVYTFLSQLRITKKETHICEECVAGMDKRFYGLRETWLKERFRQP